MQENQIQSRFLPFFRMLRRVLPPWARMRLQRASADRSARYGERMVEMTAWAEFWAGKRDA